MIRPPNFDLDWNGASQEGDPKISQWAEVARRDDFFQTKVWHEGHLRFERFSSRAFRKVYIRWVDLEILR